VGRHELARQHGLRHYRSSAAENWHDAADQSRMSLAEYSERWFMYPWPRMSAVEGPMSGMEYPMIEAAFDDAFRTYITRWAYTHPTPTHFFRTMEDAGGRRLDWFWREWFQENARFDQGIDSVATAQRGDTTLVTVQYANNERGVLPIRARFTFTDGTTEDMWYPAEMWSTNSTRYMRRYEFVDRTVLQIELDPELRLVDINSTNNQWPSRATDQRVP